MLGDTLPVRNSAWLNAGPRALIAFTGDNADVKFPLRLPIQAETHEVMLFDVRREACLGNDILEQAADMQSAMAAQAGYFGGYTAKMQPVGALETRRMGEALDRKIEREATSSTAKEFQKYSKRLVKDLESKGVARTSVESTNLSLYADHPDVLMAECVRTFPTVTFPANLLLKREEIETLKVPGTSVIAAVYHGRGAKNRMHAEAPFDLMYGFRGAKYNVDLLSPYEMLMHWVFVRKSCWGVSLEMSTNPIFLTTKR
jgi:hypothetical protein